MVYVSQQQFQYETYVDYVIHHDNWQATNRPDLIPNMAFPISLSREKPQDYGEEITTCEILHPPLASFPNETHVINNLGDGECLQGKEPICICF